MALRMRFDLESLAVTEEAVAQLPKLPPVHHGPCGRLPIGQAIAQGRTGVTPDVHIQRYPIGADQRESECFVAKTWHKPFRPNARSSSPSGLRADLDARQRR